RSPLFFPAPPAPHALHPFPTRRSSDLTVAGGRTGLDVDGVTSWSRGAFAVDASVTGAGGGVVAIGAGACGAAAGAGAVFCAGGRSEEHTSELQSLRHLVCRLLLEKKKT